MGIPIELETPLGTFYVIIALLETVNPDKRATSDASTFMHRAGSTSEQQEPSRISAIYG